MYDVLKSFIDHVWISGQSTPGDQTLLYQGGIALAIICFILVYDLITRIFAGVLRRNK